LDSRSPRTTRQRPRSTQLIAVTDNLNQAKGDKDPATWLPPLDSFKCNYVVAWIQVKRYYNLTIDSVEKTALTNTLDSHC